MKIIIAGAGEVGFHLSKLLSYESHEIILIDSDKDRLLYAGSKLDIKTLQKDATSIKALKNANIDQTDLFIAVTSSETTNITACVISKKLGAKKTIARISNSEFTDNKEKINFSELGIDELISTEELATNEIKLLLENATFNETHEFEGGKLTMVAMILSNSAPFVGKTVMESAGIFAGINFMPVIIKRKNSSDTIIPRGDTIFKVGDQVYFITLPEGVEELNGLSALKNKPIKNVLILGGSKIGQKTARDLCGNNLNIKLIEYKKKRAIELAEELPNALVIYGDGRDVDLLEEENVSDMDAVVAVTGRSETNIMSCLVAQSKGVDRTIALVQNVDYFSLSKNIGIDTLINKKLLAANSIFRYIRKGDVVEMTILNDVNAEILEFQAHNKSKITKKPIKDLKFPRNAIIGGVIRDNTGLIALGDFKIQEGDKVVVCCFPNTISKVERFFN
ncbi:Trk system potassium transporter TrkA [Lutimonas zeaxanthinifaciens]|uniref:Trk system potassium transporter TrkA n=1 Tax=Lutimonas zeaxanthinifaciens TaxID=3060215 RepID=UPI00265D5C35|nr:Trk system potassium transporter TrkA [Lutimonas sp. YSD2104]WKK66769.1 Trk system potassium transporter TrkA [Lutimonas sp. YSD2104]